MSDHPLIEFQKIQQLPKNERTEALLQWIQKVLGEERSESTEFPFGPIPHWVKCSEKKPEKDQECLTWNGRFYFLERFDYDLDGRLCFSESGESITHWMSLPPPPDEEK